MKIICSKKDLLKAINIVSKAVPVRTTLPILECVLITANSEEITFTANDMEMGIETKVPGNVIEKGIIALDARLFSEIIKNLPDNDVTIETEKEYQTKITCEKTEFNIAGKDGEDFSYLPYIEKNYKITISQFILKEAIFQTLFSIAAVDTNKMMTGELFEIEGEKLRIVSLDGHRISIRNIKLKENYECKKVIVPGKTLNDISKILTGGTDDQVDIFITDNHILFEFDNNVIVSRLIEGNYFNVDQMLPKEYDTKITVNRQNLMDSINRSTLLLKEGDKRPIIQDIEESNMELKMSSYIGTLDEFVEVEMEGKPVKIGFNPRFLLDALRVIEDETIDIFYTNSKAPCIIKDEEENYIYLILPVNFVE